MGLFSGLCIAYRILSDYLPFHHTEIPKIVDPGAAMNYPSATGSIIVGISEAPDARGENLTKAF
jgi:hypothetical protein